MNDRRRKTKSRSPTMIEGAQVSLANVRGKSIDPDAWLFLNEKKPTQIISSLDPLEK